MRDVQISEDALEDLNNGFLFYEAQESDLGEYFAACLRGGHRRPEKIRWNLMGGLLRLPSPAQQGFSLRDLLHNRAGMCGGLGRCGSEEES